VQIRHFREQLNRLIAAMHEQQLKQGVAAGAAAAAAVPVA
jgi:hypothetical protein